MYFVNNSSLEATLKTQYEKKRILLKFSFYPSRILRIILIMSPGMNCATECL